MKEDGSTLLVYLLINLRIQHIKIFKKNKKEKRKKIPEENQSFFILKYPPTCCTSQGAGLATVSKRNSTHPLQTTFDF